MALKGILGKFKCWKKDKCLEKELEILCVFWNIWEYIDLYIYMNELCEIEEI